MMEASTVRTITDSRGYEEALHSAPDGLLILLAPQIDVSVYVWYAAGTVAVNLPHPRLEYVASFFFNVTPERLDDIISHPWRNVSLKYAYLRAPPLQELYSEESAIRRQLSGLEAEEANIASEKAALQKRLRELPKVARSAGKPSGGGLFGVTGLDELERRKRELAEDVRFLEAQKTKNQEELRHIVMQKRMTSKSVDDAAAAAAATAAAGTSWEGASPSSPRALRYRSSLRKSESSAGGGGIAGVSQMTTEGGAAPNHAGEEPTARHGSSSDGGGFRSQKSVYLNQSLSSMQRGEHSSSDRYKGNRCLYSFANDAYQQEFAKAWAEKPVAHVALHRGYIIVYEDGGVAWWDIPQALDQKFRDDEARLPPVKFATLGPAEHYFVKFANGKMEWVAKDTFQTAVKAGVETRALSVERVAFGRNGQWAILWNDGSTEYEGVPPDLSSLLDEAGANRGPGVHDVNLGPSGEWFIIFTDNSVQANNLSDSLHRGLARIKRRGGRVRSIVFGDQGSWYVRYWDGST